MNLSKELETAKFASQKMAEVQMKYFRKELKVIRKAPREFVSNVDIECQNIANEILSKEFDYEIFSEETKKEITDSDYFWIVDPVDGTHNYISGLPNFGVSIALVNQGEFVLGLINIPFFDEMYYATRGNGAFLNGKEVQVSKNSDIQKSMVTYDNQFYQSKESFNTFKEISELSFTSRILGSAIYDLSLVATGIIDARILNHTKIFDFAAGAVIVIEAGGRVTNFSGEPVSVDSTQLIATNGRVHDSLVSLLGNRENY